MSYLWTVNFLAHIHLSGPDKDLRFGNFIADGIRGKEIHNFPKNVQAGIQLHRAIDSFTDQHPTFRAHCKLLSPDHGHYGRVIMDVVYDHLLAQHWNDFHDQPLAEFAQDFYRETELRKETIPQKMQRLFQLMQEQDWLVEYSRVEGLERILFHMSKRTSFPSNFPKAVAVVEENKTLLLPAFADFYHELQVHCKNHLQITP